MEPAREVVEVRCAAPPAQLWPAVSDTNRLNRVSGLGEVVIRPLEDEAGAARHLVTTRLGPLSVEWAELPFEWLAPRRLSVRREVRKGPLTEIVFSLTLDPHEGGTRAVAQVELTPRNRSALPLASVAAKVVARRLGQGLRDLDGEVTADVAGAVRDSVSPRDLDAALARLSAQARLEVRRLVGRLRTLVERGRDDEVARVRPFELADAWGAPRRDVLELCLHGAVAGVFDLSWDVICPSCRTAAAQLPELDALTASGHCALCDINFDVEMDQVVEASFRPCPAVRSVPDVEFCTGGPGATPHVVAQVVVDPAAAMPAPAEAGRYRLFVRGGAVAQIDVRPDGPAQVALTLGERVEPGAATIAPGGALSLGLADGVGARHAKLEHLEWASRAATAYEVTTLPVFQALFSQQALKPGLGLRIGRATLLFSDLSASTALYAREGDAGAFRLVQEHFDLLKRCVQDHEGAIVKTMGDAVMASFTNEVQALAAAIDAQRAFGPFRAEHHPASDGVHLKIGVFTGPCYAVTANGALDYFGQTVNVAARLQGQAGAGEIVVPEAWLDRVAGEPILDGLAFSAPFVPALKGVEEGLSVLRLRVPSESEG